MFVAWYQSPRQRGVLGDNWSYFLSKPYVVAPHLGCLLWDGSEGGGVTACCFYAGNKKK